MDVLGNVTFDLLAQGSDPMRQSYLGMMRMGLGPIYALLLPLSGFLVFVGACLVVALNRRPAVIASYLVILPLPLLIGLFGTLHGFLASYQVIYISEATPKMANLHMVLVRP